MVLLTVKETLVPSVATSALIFVAVGLKSPLFADVAFVKLAFFALLPTLLAIVVVQDEYLIHAWKRAFQVVFRCADPMADPDASWASAFASARADLYKSFMERWTGRKNLVSSSSQRRSSGGRRRRDAERSSNTTELLSASTSGKSLYEQVKENLTDHVFQKKMDAPIYFMDPTTGLFLKVNHEHKLVFTSTPDTSCLFNVVKGKTHHWGFMSTIYQRYIGQNFVGRMIVNSKKLAGWEAFRVLQRPDDGGSTGAKGEKECSNTIYMILCSSRFGKGMWLAKNRRSTLSLSHQSSNSSSSYASRSGSSRVSSSNTRSSAGEHTRDNIYLSKNFANALALTYASDLAAFEYLTNDRFMNGSRSASTWKASLSAPLPTAMDTTFQLPVLAVSERNRVSFPWIEDPSTKQFFELQDKQFTEVISTTITRCTMKEFLNLFFDEDFRKMTHERDSATANATAKDDKRLSEWHVHPHFGFVRKLSYRPAATLEHEDDSKPGRTDGTASVKAVAIDQYHSCTLSEKTLNKSIFRSKMYTLSIPYSNCFSIETLFELEDLADTVTGGPSPVKIPVLQVKCKTGVHFTRPTMLAALIEKGALQGVKRVCDMLLELAKDNRGRSSASQASTTASSSVGKKSPAGGSKASLPPNTLPIEVIKAMITSFREAKSLDDSLPSLPTKLPWKANSDVDTTRVDGVPRTNAPFFESAAHQFKMVLDESLGGKITPSLFFDSLLSDECSFFHVVHRQSGNMNVDIGAWRKYSPTKSADSDVGPAYIRMQVFRMPIDGIPGVEIAQVKDYQYYSFAHDEHTGKKRLEFGMKLAVRDFPDGENYS
uniref:VASt domain-containing protein n=1 Tax=Globisporangium ultimum (strain ATCC 200006 / CBS 805.95 / DAOM BR144) TaxID=431595 RepID=K3W945_GLOUD